MDKVEKIIREAFEKYPLSVWYTGRLTEEEIEAIEPYCNISCGSVYMNGEATYSIRKRI